MNEWREWYAKDLARHAVLNAHRERLGLPEGAEVVSFYLLNTPWEDWGMNEQGEEQRYDGERPTLTIHYLVDGAGPRPLESFSRYVENQEALTLNNVIVEILMDEISKATP
jgi:hypothetical protein